MTWLGAVVSAVSPNSRPDPPHRNPPCLGATPTSSSHMLNHEPKASLQLCWHTHSSSGSWRASLLLLLLLYLSLPLWYDRWKLCRAGKSLLCNTILGLAADPAGNGLLPDALLGRTRWELWVKHGSCLQVRQDEAAAPSSRALCGEGFAQRSPCQMMNSHLQQ